MNHYVSNRREYGMWFKHYRDYPIDKPLIKEQVEPGHGIIGCEMHDLNGWGTQHHIPRRHWKKRWLPAFLSDFLKKKSHRHG